MRTKSDNVETETSEAVTPAPVTAAAVLAAAPPSSETGGDFVPGAAGAAPTATPIVPSTEGGKFCACEKCPKDSEAASLPRLLVNDTKQVDGKTVEFKRNARYGFCEKHGAAVAEPHRRTAEEWAHLRGYLPEKAAGKDGAPAVHNKRFRHYQEARFHNWGGIVGREMTLSEFDAGVRAATDHVYR